MKPPRGFLASGIRSGIRAKRPNLALIVAPGGAAAATVFTRTRFQAAPVDLGAGSARASRVTCDLGHDYITMNAGYRT
jgi:N-acetylglutamate synthase/N-acetylornithine aminotransferase